MAARVLQKVKESWRKEKRKMSLGPYTNSWSNGSLFPGYKQGLLFGLHKSLFQKKLQTLKRYIKVTGKNVIFKELL